MVEATEHGVQLDERFVPACSEPLGVIPDKIREALQDDEVTRWMQTLDKRYHGKHVLAAVDKFEGTRGVRQKLLAYEMFLDQNPGWAEKVVLIQVAMSTSGDRHIPEVSDVVERIVSSSCSFVVRSTLRGGCSIHGFLVVRRAHSSLNRTPGTAPLSIKHSSS